MASDGPCRAKLGVLICGSPRDDRWHGPSGGKWAHPYKPRRTLREWLRYWHAYLWPPYLPLVFFLLVSASVVLFLLTRCAPPRSSIAAPQPTAPPAASTMVDHGIQPPPVQQPGSGSTATSVEVFSPDGTPTNVPIRPPVEVGLTINGVRGARLIPAANLPNFAAALPNSQTCCVDIVWRFTRDDAVPIEGAAVRFVLTVDGTEEQAWTVAPATGLLSHMRFHTVLDARRVWPHHKLSARLEIQHPSTGVATETWTIFGPIFAKPAVPALVVLQRAEPEILDVLVDRNGSTRSRAARH